MHYGARLAAAMDTSVRQMLNAFSPLLTRDFEIHPAVALYSETKSKNRPSTWPEYDDLLEEIFASGKEAEADRGIAGNVPEVGVKLAAATSPTFPSESLVVSAEDFAIANGNQSILNSLDSPSDTTTSPARTRAQSMSSTPEYFGAQATLPNKARSFSPIPCAASRDSLPCDPESCSEATLIPKTTTTKKREHGCQDESAPTKRQRTDLGCPTIEKPILPHSPSKPSKTTDRKRKLKDHDNHSTATKKQRQNPGSLDTEKPLSPPVSSQPATTTTLKRKLNELTIEHESRKKQCTSFPNDPIHSSTIDDSGLVLPTPETKIPQRSSEPTLPNTSTAASSAGESPEHTVADGPISVTSQSILAEPHTLHVLDERFIIDASPLGLPFGTSTSPASLSARITQAPNSSPRPNTLDPNLKTNTPSTPANQQTDAVKNIPGLGRLCEIQGQGTLSSLLDVGLNPEFQAPEESAFSYPSSQANSSISESSNNWQSSSWCDFSTSSTLVDFGSCTNTLRSSTQSYEYPISNPLVYGTPNNPVYQEPEPTDYPDQASGFLAPSQNQDSEPFGTQYHYPAVPSVTPDDLSIIDPQLLALDNSIASPFYNPSLSSAPLLNEHPLFSSPQSSTTPDIQSHEHQNAPPDLPQFSRMFSPQSAIICQKSPLPYLLQRQVSPLPPIRSRTPRSPIDDSYDDDDFRISSAEPTARELKLRAGKVLRQHRTRIKKRLPPPSKLRNCMTVITDAEKRFMAELEHELEQELERGSDDESPVKISHKRSSSDVSDDDGEHSAKRSRRC